mgnify:CR=1 FL=1
MHHAHGITKAATWSLLDEPAPVASSAVSIPDSKEPEQKPTQPSDTPKTAVVTKPKNNTDAKKAAPVDGAELTKKVKFLEGKLSGIQQSASSWKDKCLKVSGLACCLLPRGCPPAAHSKQLSIVCTG